MRSKIALSLTVIFLISFRVFYSDEHKPIKVTTYDALGYYMYIPSFIIYKDFKQLNWKDRIEEKYKVFGGDFYQADKVDNGNYVFKYYGGVAIMQLPFFALAHVYAKNSEFPSDGFSKPYQLSVVFASIFYALIGFIILQQFLLNFYSDNIVAIVILTIVFATNMTQYISIDCGQTHSYLFFVYSLILYLTYNWYKTPLLKTAFYLGLSCGLAITTRPTEMICIFIPLLWVSNYPTIFIRRLHFWKSHKKHVGYAIVGGFLILLPQIIYWKISSGSFIYDVGSKWVFANPFFKVLFGWEKGWFIYTPITIFFIVGLFFVKDLPFKKSIWMFVFLNIWIIISWFDWRYGGSYSTRALSHSYPIFAIGLASFLNSIRLLLSKISVGVIFVYLSLVNVFQLFQYNDGIIHYNDMNRKYYSHIYLNPNPSYLDYSLLDTKDWLPKKSRNIEKILKEPPTQLKRNNKRIVLEKIILENKNRDYFIKTSFRLKMKKGFWDSSILVKVKSGTEIIKSENFRLNTPPSKVNESNKYEFFTKIPANCMDCSYSIILSRPEIDLQFLTKNSVMKGKKTITLATKKPTYQGYSYAFKIAIVERVELGQISINQASKEYEVSRSGIQKWIKKYGSLDKKLRSMGGKSPKQEIAELKKKLRLAEERALIWECAVEILEEDFKIDAKKKYLTVSQRSILKKHAEK